MLLKLLIDMNVFTLEELAHLRVISKPICEKINHILRKKLQYTEYITDRVKIKCKAQMIEIKMGDVIIIFYDYQSFYIATYVYVVCKNHIRVIDISHKKIIVELAKLPNNFTNFSLISLCPLKVYNVSKGMWKTSTPKLIEFCDKIYMFDKPYLYIVNGENCQKLPLNSRKYRHTPNYLQTSRYIFTKNGNVIKL